MYHLFGKKAGDGSESAKPPKGLTQDRGTNMNFTMEEVIEDDNAQIALEAEQIKREAMAYAPKLPSIFTEIAPPGALPKNVPLKNQPVPPPLPPRGEVDNTPDPVVWPIPDGSVEPDEPTPEPIPIPEPTPRPQPRPQPRPMPPQPPRPQPRPQPKPRPDIPIPPPPPPPKPKEKEEDPCASAISDFSVLLENINESVMQKIKDLEDLVKTRSEEIRKHTKISFEEAIERARQMKQIMHDAEMKDLDVQMKHMEILDKAEERALERAMKMKSL